MSYSKELSLRLRYIFITWLLISFVAWNEGSDILLDICFEPWAQLWGGETMFYRDPAELWKAELLISGLVGLVVTFPALGLHFIFFLANSLTRSELHHFIIVWCSSILLLWTYWYIMIEQEGISLLMDLSHGDDEDDEVSLCTLIYVPTVSSYLQLWLALRSIGSRFSQLPLVWIYYIGKRLPARLGDARTTPWQNTLSAERFLFIIVFVIPLLISVLLLVDEIRTSIVFVRFIRRRYLRILWMTSYWYRCKLDTGGYAT